MLFPRNDPEEVTEIVTDTAAFPHLHLELGSCLQQGERGTLPLTFNNTSAHPDGLQVGKLYRAR